MNKQIIKTIALTLAIGTFSAANLNAMSPQVEQQMKQLANKTENAIDKMPGTAVVTTVIATGTVAAAAVPLTGYAIGKKVAQYIKKSNYLKAAGLYGAALVTSFGLDKINENIFNDNELAKVLSSIALGSMSLSLKVIPSIMALNQLFNKTLKIDEVAEQAPTPVAN